MNLYFGTLYNPNLYIDVRFLALAQALETYDFRRRDLTDVPPAEHAQRLEEILAKTPERHREWLKKKLANSNLLTLRRRVRGVLAECPVVRDRVVGTTSAQR